MTEPHRYQYADVVDRVGVDLYTVSMVADAVGKSAATVRRWLRYVESPKPSHHAVNGLVEMRLWDDDDLNELRQWSSKLQPGPNPKHPRTKRRLPDQPYDPEEVESRLSLKDMEKLPPKERPAQKWARLRGGKVVEKKVSTGKNEVTVLAIEKES